MRGVTPSSGEEERNYITTINYVGQSLHSVQMRIISTLDDILKLVSRFIVSIKMAPIAHNIDKKKPTRLIKHISNAELSRPDCRQLAER